MSPGDPLTAPATPAANLAGGDGGTAAPQPSASAARSGESAAPTIEAAAAGARESDADGDAIDYPLHARVHELWQWQAALSGVIVAVVAFVPATIFGIVFGSFRVGGGFALIAALVGLLVWRLNVRYHRAFAKTFRCTLMPDGLLVQRGVFWRTQTFVPRARVQHTDVNEGPIARHFGIAALIVFTAGTAESQVTVDGLARERALDLRDRLLGRDGDDAV